MNDSATIVLAVGITHYYGFDGSRVQTIKKTNVANIIVYIYINHYHLKQNSITIQMFNEPECAAVPSPSERRATVCR